MSRRVILLDFPWARDKDPRLPLGHACLLSALKAAPNIEPRSLVMAANDPTINIDDLSTHILAECDDERSEIDLAVGVYVWSEGLVGALLPNLRARGFRGRIILGGPQISYAAEGVERLYPDADVFVRGFAEAALVEVLSSTARKRIQGVVYRGGFDQGQQANINFDETPSPWLDGTFHIEPGSFVRWETQRGCPFRCSFCQHREAGQSVPRQRSESGRIGREIELFVERGVREIAVLDPVFNSGGPTGARRSTRLLRRFSDVGYRGRLSLQCRPEHVDDDFIDACAALDTCLEFGLQTTERREWKPIQRGNKLETVDVTLSACRNKGVDHQVSLIFGLPEQTIESFERSLAWCLEREVPVIKAFPLMLLRGTELERTRSRWSLRETTTPMPIVCSSSTFDERDWLRMAQLSQALRMTERNHPRSIEGLRALAHDLECDESRWNPTRDRHPA